MLIPCVRCSQSWEKQNKTLPNKLPFYCRLCRCADCQAIFNFHCECGETHAVQSAGDPRLCVDCVAIRERVESLSPEMLRYRAEKFATEELFY